MTDAQTDEITSQLQRLNGVSTSLLRAERIKLLGPEPIKTVWFDNSECKFFIPDALDDRIQSLILETGQFFEAHNLRAVKDMIKPGSTVIDVGSNIGNHSIFFAKVCGAAQVHAFEPQTRLTQIIARNREINGLEEDRIVIHNYGCGAVTGYLRIMHYNTGNLGATRFAYADSGDFEVKRLDDCGIGHVDFLKIDSEGMGPEVLKGAAGLIEKCSPTIWIELYGEEVDPAHAFMAELGYAHSRKLTRADFMFSKTPL